MAAIVAGPVALAGLLALVLAPARAAAAQAAADRAVTGTGSGHVSATGSGATVDARPAITTVPHRVRTLRLVTFNVEHLMSAARFAEWRAFCAPRGWRDGAGGERPERLTYCDALDGTDGRGRRLSAPVRDEATRGRKVAQLAALLRRADADIVLLQEVSDAAAAAELLGPGYRVATTAERWAGHAIAQNLAVAWRVTLPGPEPVVSVVEPISRIGADGRRTRPGLALTLEPAPGERLAILNLHLKAGCRQGRLTDVTSRQPERAHRRAADCAVFRSQVPAIERWVDARLADGTHVLVTGDFNRDLVRELRERMPARSDGADPASPADPDRIASLFAELSDAAPAGARFTLVRAGPYGKLADCHRAITHFVLGETLATRLATSPQALATRVLPFDAPVSLDRPRPSDHCPHVLDLPLRANP